jgi:hypothetical protein
MNTRDQLNHYLLGLEKRLRWLTVSKGVAIALGVALVATLAMVWFTNALAFSSTSITIARVVLFLASAAALGFALVLPLMRLNRKRTADRAESTFPEFDQRLLTYIERGESRDPMLDLLAKDAFSVANKTRPERVAPRTNIFGFATAGAAAGAVLLWMILAGPGFLGYGSSLLWAGLPKGNNGVNFYDIIVEPGNKMVRRKADQMVTATLTGFQAPQVRLFARYKSASKWEEAAMVPRSSGTAYEFLFASLPEPVEYYVEAAGVKSKTFKLDVADLPGIKNIKVTYHYPSWLGLPDAVEDPGGDLRAVAGTVAELAIETDRPLKNGEILMDDGSRIALQSKDGNFVTAKIPVEKDGMYHFAATERGESVRLSEDYFIEARQDQAPTVKIVTPRGDAKVSPIEEVSITVEAADDFALQSMELHYSVNGAPEKTVSLLPEKGVKQANGKTLISLEDYKLEAGDVVSIYATAKDARNTARTDIAFIETQPFEKNYTQSQQQGGMPGMPMDNQDQTEISKRQKEIIAATWNEIRGGAKDKVNSAENAKFLAGVQRKLKEQAKSLADRARSRELAGANQEFQSFVKDLDEAVKQMDPASNKLGAQSWKDALEPEQKALQHLLRAEATFRDIQVAFGGGSKGGGGGQNAGRDLANLFDLELDTEKNQYETGQQQSTSAQAKEKAVDEALQKLEQLAQRQKQLAEQQAKSKQQTFEQRWQQEMLRREAEELKKQMEQLSRDGSQGQSASSQGQEKPNSGGQGQPSQGGKQSSNQPQQAGSSSSQQNPQGGKQQPQQQGKQQQQQRSLGQRNNTNDQRLQQALERISQATDDMREAQKASQQGQQNGQPGQQSGQQPKGGSQGAQPNGQQGNQAGQAEANARRAAERLQEAKSLLGGMRRQESSSQLSDLQQRADALAAEQRDLENRMRRAFGAQAIGDPRAAAAPDTRQTAEQMAAEKEKMAAELERLETDMKKSARDLASTQPDASARVREGLSEIQQNEAKSRMTASATWLRRGQGPLMVPREAPVTQALDKVAEDLRQAQSALRNGGQSPGNNDLERSLARVERMRSQMERMAGNGQPDKNGQQNGQQNGGQQDGKQQGSGQKGGGQQSGGNQPGNSQTGGQQTGGGQQGGRPQTGGGYGGAYGPRGGNRQYGGGFGRFGPEGMYDAPLDRPVDPMESARLAARDLNDMRQLFKDNPDIQKEITEVEHELQKLTIGDIATAELQQRLNREILPNLQALEVKLRRQVEEQGGGQVRSGATDKVPAGFSDAVAEYFRKLSKGN